MFQLSNRLSRIEEPQTIKMAKLSRELKAQGKDIIDLSLGEPDFATPQHIKDAADVAMAEGFTKYPPVAGFPELKQAIIAKFETDNKLKYELNEVMACTGAKQCIANVMMSIINDGDEVVIPSPYWVTYGDLVKVCGGNVIAIKASLEQDYKINAAQLEAAITSKTKAFIFSSPCNPTGSIYNADELQALVSVFEKHPNIVIISDEIYEYINFEGTHISIATYGTLKNRTVVINGLSKAYSMTGWRLGFMAGPASIIKACENMQSQFTSGPNSITQRAAITALNGPKESIHEMVAAFKERRNYLVNALKQIPGIKTNNPPGAFYVFPDISAYFGKSNGDHRINNSLDLCMYLLHTGNVSCVTGSAFGDDNCIRMSYATSMENLQKAVARITEALAQLN
jgi:aspartate aminotransferase